jgi:hypothetical protein
VSRPRHRAARVIVWVTRAEKEALEHRAEDAQLRLSDYVRRTLLGDAVGEDGRHLRRQRREEET